MLFTKSGDPDHVEVHTDAEFEALVTAVHKRLAAFEEDEEKTVPTWPR